MQTIPIIYYFPLLTTLISLLFAFKVRERYYLRGDKAKHLYWWCIGVLTYGMGALAEGLITTVGWNPVLFKFWYIVGALMGGAPLAQGTVWLLLKPRTAKILTYLLFSAIGFASIFIILSPINYANVNPQLPSGKAMQWQWVRLFSPFINTYAVVFLIGGAIISAGRFYRQLKKKTPQAEIFRDRFIGNCLIAFGAILPGVGGFYSRLGHTEYLYIGELIGILIIWMGYWLNVRKRPIHKKAKL